MTVADGVNLLLGLSSFVAEWRYDLGVFKLEWFGGYDCGVITEYDSFRRYLVQNTIEVLLIRYVIHFRPTSYKSIKWFRLDLG